MKRQTIKSIGEFSSVIAKINGDAIHNNQYKNGRIYFRGQSDTSYALLPAIWRSGYRGNLSLLEEERNLIETARFKMPEVFRRDMRPLESLALMQHHGIPTRLLDVTENALVALYFACCSQYEKDGEVFVFKSTERDVENYPLLNAIAESYRFINRRTNSPVHSFYESVMEQPYYVEQQREAGKDTREEIEGRIRKLFSAPIFVYAPIRSQRQQIQQGAYILFPNKLEKTESGGEQFTKDIEPLDKNADVVYAVITIPKNVKRRLLSDLRLFGVSRQTLFADSIDIVCQEITKDYNDRVRKSG